MTPRENGGKARKLILMNGRWGHDNGQHIYIAAYSKADAARILNGLQEHINGDWHGWLYEINKYFNKGVWGNKMDGIKPERGAWVTESYGTRPRKVS